MLFGISSDLFVPGVSILEKIIRPLVIYVFLLAAFRIFGKRQLGQLTKFDFIVLLIISNVVQNAMIGNDTSLTGGIIGAATLLVANSAVAYLTFRFPRLDDLIAGQPTVLVQDGKILYKNLEHELVTEHDLFHALRKNQVDPDTDMPNLKRVLLDSDGSIIIVRKGPMTRGGAQPS
jgi:uncharacterized membrane protein YcaP (DUF421 family)